MWPWKQRKSRLFICLEGIDCTGKTTVAQALCELTGATYFHGPSEPLKSLISGLPDPNDRVLEYFLHRAAVQNDCKEIERQLDVSHVVADRYICSTRAYFGASVPALIGLADQIGLRMPDATYLLVADRAAREARLRERGTSIPRERDMEFQGAAQQIFLRQGHPVIDTTHLNVAGTAKIILRKIRQRYGTRI